MTTPPTTHPSALATLAALAPRRLTPSPTVQTRIRRLQWKTSHPRPGSMVRKPPSPTRSQPVALQMTNRPVCRKRRQKDPILTERMSHPRENIRSEQPPSPARVRHVALQMTITPSAQRVPRTQMIFTTSPGTRLPRARERPPSGLALGLTALLLSRETRSLRRKAEVFHGFQVTRPPIITPTKRVTRSTASVEHKIPPEAVTPKLDKGKKRALGSPSIQRVRRRRRTARTYDTFHSLPRDEEGEFTASCLNEQCTKATAPASYSYIDIYGYRGCTHHFAAPSQAARSAHWNLHHAEECFRRQTIKRWTDTPRDNIIEHFQAPNDQLCVDVLRYGLPGNTGLPPSAVAPPHPVGKDLADQREAWDRAVNRDFAAATLSSKNQGASNTLFRVLHGQKLEELLQISSTNDAESDDEDSEQIEDDALGFDESDAGLEEVDVSFQLSLQDKKTHEEFREGTISRTKS
jgi:hypothetical protein